MDTLVFDIETKNFFTDPGVGWNNFEALQISAVGIYSYRWDKYFCFDEFELDKVAELFDVSSLLVGFSINRYDIPVLNAHFQKIEGISPIDLWEKSRLDILEEIELAIGERISLDKLSRANLGIGKERKSYEAITLYKNGEIDELKKYCLQDVRLTKEIYDLYRQNHQLLVPDRKGRGILTVDFTPISDYLFISNEATAASKSPGTIFT